MLLKQQYKIFQHEGDGSLNALYQFIRTAECGCTLTFWNRRNYSTQLEPVNFHEKRFMQGGMKIDSLYWHDIEKILRDGRRWDQNIQYQLPSNVQVQATQLTNRRIKYKSRCTKITHGIFDNTSNNAPISANVFLSIGCAKLPDVIFEIMYGVLDKIHKIVYVDGSALIKNAIT